MKPFTVREARDNLYRLIDGVVQSHQPITIKGKCNNAVLVSREDLEAISETVYLNSITVMVDAIHTAAAEPLSEVKRLEDLDW